MALFKKERGNLPDLPTPPSKFSEISKPDFDEDFAGYSSPLDLNEEHFEEKPEPKKMRMTEFSNNQEEEGHFDRKPLFVKIEKYEDALTIINSIKEKLNDADSIIGDLRHIRREEDARLDEWSTNLSEIKDKLANIDNMLFE